MAEGPAAGFRRRVKQTPPFLADAAASDLCEHRPPFGLLDKPSRMSAIAALAASYGLEPGVATGAGGRLADGRAAIPKGREAASANESRSLCAAVATALLAASGRPRRASLGSCAVVGSAGGLFGSGSGEEIDSHESVIRFNSAPAGGRFADHVGRRTSLFVAPHCREKDPPSRQRNEQGGPPCLVRRPTSRGARRRRMHRGAAATRLQRCTASTRGSARAMPTCWRGEREGARSC